MGLKGGISIDADSGPLGYFDAVVAKVKTFLHLVRLALAILCLTLPSLSFFEFLFLCSMFRFGEFYLFVFPFQYSDHFLYSFSDFEILFCVLIQHRMREVDTNPSSKKRFWRTSWQQWHTQRAARCGLIIFFVGRGGTV